MFRARQATEDGHEFLTLRSFITCSWRTHYVRGFNKRRVDDLCQRRFDIYSSRSTSLYYRFIIDSPQCCCCDMFKTCSFYNMLRTPYYVCVHARVFVVSFLFFNLIGFARCAPLFCFFVFVCCLACSCPFHVFALLAYLLVARLQGFALR